MRIHHADNQELHHLGHRRTFVIVVAEAPGQGSPDVLVYG